MSLLFMTCDIVIREGSAADFQKRFFGSMAALISEQRECEERV